MDKKPSSFLFLTLYKNISSWNKLPKNYLQKCECKDFCGELTLQQSRGLKKENVKLLFRVSIDH